MTLLSTDDTWDQYTAWIFLIGSLVYIIAYYLLIKQNKDDFQLENNRIYLFYADWCPHCTRFKPIWTRVAKSNPNYKFILINEKTSPELIKNMGITSYPTIIAYKNNTKHIYNKERTFEKFRKWIRAL